MTDNKKQVADAIVSARDSLEQALSALERLHMLDPSAVAFSTHALNNYLTITGGTIELLQASLIAHPDPQIHTWLEGLQHATNLMTYTVGRLMNSAITQDIQLRFEQTNLPVLVQRVCLYYQRVANHKDIHLPRASSAPKGCRWISVHPGDRKRFQNERALQGQRQGPVAVHEAHGTRAGLEVRLVHRRALGSGEGHGRGGE